MTKKHPICPRRLRQVPKQFSWVDQRLVRDRYIDQVSHQAAALYLFLIMVADSQGLSFYSDPSLMKRLCLEELTLQEARRNQITLQDIFGPDFQTPCDGLSECFRFGVGIPVCIDRPEHLFCDREAERAFIGIELRSAGNFFGL